MQSMTFVLKLKINHQCSKMIITDHLTLKYNKVTKYGSYACRGFKPYITQCYILTLHSLKREAQYVEGTHGHSKVIGIIV